MIRAADEFKCIFDSAQGEERERVKKEADDAVWLEVVEKYPDLGSV